MTTSVFIAVSLDGYIARPNGDIDWLGNIPAQGTEDYGYKRFMDSVDTLVMGRNTFEKVLTFGVWPYGAKPVVVLSHHSLPPLKTAVANVERMSGAAAEIVHQLSARGLRHAYIDGGKTIQDFLNAGLIRRLIITRIPILLGAGIPLFGPLQRDIPLKLVETHAFPGGLEQSAYEVLP